MRSAAPVVMEEADIQAGEFSDSPTISDTRTLSDSEVEQGRVSDFLDYTPSQSFSAPVTYLEVRILNYAQALLYIYRWVESRNPPDRDYRYRAGLGAPIWSAGSNRIGYQIPISCFSSAGSSHVGRDQDK